MTKLLHAPILLDEATAEHIRSNLSTDVMRVRRAAKVRPYGTESALIVSELLPAVAEAPQLTDEQIHHYEEALEQFIAGRWSDALELLHLVPAKDRVIVEGVNFIKRHTRPNPQKNVKGGIVEREAPLHASNVQLVCPECGKQTRIGRKRLDDGRSVRFCVKCEGVVDK